MPQPIIESLAAPISIKSDDTKHMLCGHSHRLLRYGKLGRGNDELRLLSQSGHCF